MTNTEILKQAITKAVEGGWSPKSVGMVTLIPDGWMEHDHYKAIIFNHDFARSLWGVQDWWVSLPGKSGEKRIEVEIPAWQMHLQQMVISEDPIKYLGENI